jgi:type I restriction enzyme S subunit
MTLVEARISELAEQVRGVSYGKEDASKIPLEGYLPVLRAGNITDVGLTYEDLVYVPSARISEKQKIRRGDVVIAASSGSLDVVGKAAPALRNFDGGFGAFCKVLRPNTSVDAKYFAHLFKRPEYRASVSALAAGANINNLRNEHLDDMLVPVLPLPEQRRIAAILDQADALRAKRREALAQLDSLTQSVFIEMFGDPEKNAKQFPILTLGEICDVRDGTHDSPKYTSAGFPLVTTKNLRNGMIDFTEVNLIAEADYVAINKRSKVDKGDILMPMIGTIGCPVLVCIEPFFAIKNMALIKFKSNSPDSQFILNFLNSDFFRKIVSSESKGGTQKFLSLGAIRGLQIPVPPVPIQHTFAKRVRSVEALKATHQAALQELDRLFASLQHRAFAGEL